MGGASDRVPYSMSRVREEVERETKRLFENIIELLELACKARESGESRIESLIVGGARELERCYKMLLEGLKDRCASEIAEARPLLCLGES